MFDWNNSTPLEKVGWLGLRLQSQANGLRMLEAYYEGTQPTAFVAPEIAEQLQHRLASLNVNYCRLLVQTLVERVTVTGFRLNGSQSVDDALWQSWQRNRMATETDWLLRDVFALGRGYLLVWVDSRGRPTVSVESPFQVITYRDPVTRECLRRSQTVVRVGRRKRAATLVVSALSA